MRYRVQVVLIVVATILSMNVARAAGPTPGADGVGDPLFPQLGNGGYDAQHYTIDLSADMDKRTLSGTVTMDAKATQDLSAFNLDFQGFDITKLTVNGTPADYSRQTHELTVKPAQAINNGDTFTSVVTYSGAPQRYNEGQLTIGWVWYDKGSYVASEPAGAAGWYPVNDHPLDKATYTFRITVAKPFVVAANGLLKGTTDNGTTTTYLWDNSKPMASYLATVDITQYAVDTATGPNGLPMRSYFPADMTADEKVVYNRTAEMIDFFNSIYGPYPFEAYGVVVADTELGFALETQTMSLFGRGVLSRRSSSTPADEVVAHELSHQWFGDSVSLKSWQDIWLNEGFATYSQFLWLEHRRGRQVLDDRMRAVYQVTLASEYATGTTAKPTQQELFDTPLIYLRGSLTLHALRVRVGDETFFRIMRTYADRYRYSNASTADFMAVAKEVSGKNLDQFFQLWLYEHKLPDPFAQ